MTEGTREVIIDDRDSRVRFTANWNTASGDTYNIRGRHGPVYRNTLQGSNADGARVSFTFNGIKADIYGTTDPEFEAGSTAPDPDWDCVLDGSVNAVAKGPSSKPTESSINRWPFCSFPNLIPGQHTIELVVRTKGRTFWFDELQYVPMDVVSGETMDVGQSDQDLSYSSGWESFRGIAFITRTRGSTVTFPFFGTGVTLLGNFHTSFPNATSTGTYRIDGGSPVPFTILGGAGTDDYNRRLFEVTGMSAGIHTLVVTYQGGDGFDSMPLMVDRFLVEGGTNVRASSGGNGGTIPGNAGSDSLPSSRSSTGSDPSRTGIIPDSNALNKRTPTASIAVGVVLGVLALVALLLLLLFLHKRRRRTQQAARGDLALLDQNELDRPEAPRPYAPVPLRLGIPLMRELPLLPEAPLHPGTPLRLEATPHPDFDAAPHPEVHPTHLYMPPDTANASGLTQAPESPNPERQMTEVRALPDNANNRALTGAPELESPGPPLSNGRQAPGSRMPVRTSSANTRPTAPDAQQMQMKTVEAPTLPVRYQDGLGDVSNR